ncbi:MAG: formylmethanofuran dehydrogenase [Peptococcaceae bacterium]|jgi:formylmethanofuran dehydrogenase subunit E|nr:formylmethanofuran dehydrogenase [Peptococcaceae bacterium]
MCKGKRSWELCVDFHGHECLGLAIGYRQALRALELLGVEKAEDEELVAIVETDACGVDAVQVLTGCTLGKGNLIYKDAGKMALTLANRKTGQAVRLIKKDNVLPEDDHFRAVREKIDSDLATKDDWQEWAKIQKERVQQYLTLPPETIIEEKEVPMPQVPKARLFQTIICSACQEPFSEGKARVKDGQIVCSDCFQEYTRGW